MSKALSIDFGLARTGLAISDNDKMFAFGIDTVKSELLMDKINELIQKEDVDEIVIGFPKRLNNEDSHVTENVRLLKVKLEEELEEVKVHLLDERFTSKMASKAMHDAGLNRKKKKQKELVDKVSATIILQDFLANRPV